MKKRITALITAISLMFGLTGCTNKKPDKYISTSIEEPTDHIVNTEETYQNYNSYFENYNVAYSDSYISNEEINTHINNASDKKICTFDSSAYLVDGKYDTKLIINAIKNNSSNYIAKNKNCSHAFFGIETTNDQVIEGCKLRFELEFEQAINKIIENATNDIEEDLCNITNLKCVIVDNETYLLCSKSYSNIDCYGTYIPEKNLIMLNRENLINLYNSTDITKCNEILSSVTNHLLNHTRQRNCQCNERNNYYPFDYSGIIDHTVLYEASAESSYYNEFGEYYKNQDNFNKEQNDEKLLFLLSIFENYDMNDYYNAIYDGNIKKLHEFFGLETNEDIQDFYKIIYSIDGINKNNDLLEQEDINIVNNNYKEGILKLVLKNMVNYTYNNSDFKIEENIALLSLVNYIINANYNEIDNNKQYINNIYILNSKYISFLQTYYNVDKEKMNYYLSDFYINKIIEEISSSYNLIPESEKQLPSLLKDAIITNQRICNMF